MSGTTRLGLPFALWGLAGRIAEPVLRLLLHRRVARGKELPDRLAERRGIEREPRPPGRLIWLHAASVGETLSLLPVLDALCRLDPALQLLLTTGTVSAQRLVAERLDPARMRHRFVPLDVPRWVNRFLDHWRPDVAVLVESELWPGFVSGCNRRAIPLALVNARLSAGSARRWSRTGPVARRLLGGFSWITARSEQDAERLRGLGARHVEHDGDLKAAAAPLPADEAELRRLRDRLAGRPLWLAASTHENEELVLAQVQRALAGRHPGVLAIVAPRHPERGGAVSNLLDAAPRRALGQDPDPAHAFWVCDTLGELGLLYRLCDLVVLGNSLPGVRGPGGGHNPLEPARLGCALAIGPLAQNFDDDVTRLGAAGGLARVSDPDALRDWLDAMLRNPDRARAMAQAARAGAEAESGLPERLARRLLALGR